MSGHYHTVNMTTLFRTVRAITRRVARRSGAIYSSLQSMAELDEISCVQIQFLPHAPRAIRFFKPEYGCMPTEKLSINRMRVLGAFPAILDDPNFKFSQGNMPPDPPSMFMHYRSVHSTEGLQTRLQTNCQSIHSDITSPY